MPNIKPGKRSKKKGKAARIPAERARTESIAFLESHERAVIIALCVLAGLRIFIFSAGFPFFNNVDESAHFDMITKYAMAHIPKTLEPYTQEALRRDPWVRSMEYLPPPTMSPDNVPRPMWRLTKSEVARGYAQCTPSMLAKINHESTQLPLYYTVMALWFRLGKLLTLDGGHLMYWLKLINIPIYVLLTWLAYRFAKRFYPEDQFLRFGAPLLLAVFPQDVFYSLNSDVFSPMLFGLALYGLLDILLSRNRPLKYHLLTGLAIAAAMMTKLPNAPILAVLGVVVILRARESSRRGHLRTELPKLVGLCLVAILPFALWLTRNYFVLGDITGDTAKVARLHWTYKPLAEIWDHPIYSGEGLGIFWSGLMQTFWRGEFVWYEIPIRSCGMDSFYVWSTSIFLPAALAGLWMFRKAQDEDERTASLFGFGAILMSIWMLGFLSTLFDFGLCIYPSRMNPYLTSGRLISGVLIPFSILYLRGLDVILTKIGLARARFAVLGAIVTAIVASELVISAPAFHSMYNWYHMF